MKHLNKTTRKLTPYAFMRVSERSNGKKWELNDNDVGFGHGTFRRFKIRLLFNQK